MAVITLKDITVYYDNVCALENIHLSIQEREFVGIIGPNGGGKTTLLKVLAGLIKPSKGEMHKSKHLKLGYIPQFTSFDRRFPITVLEVILTGALNGQLRLFKKFTTEECERAKRIMALLKIDVLKHRQIGQLSGGQLQKVLIARALMVEPEVLLLDEPTASIDTNSKKSIYHLLKELNREKTIVIVSHDLSEVLTDAKKIVCVNKTLHYHGDNTALSKETLEEAYGCPVEAIIQQR